MCNVTLRRVPDTIVAVQLFYAYGRTDRQTHDEANTRFMQNLCRPLTLQGTFISRCIV